MTVEEKKNAIEQLQNLNRSGVISDEEMLEKISKIDVDVPRSYRSERHASEKNGKKSTGNSFVFMVLSCLALILIYFFIMGLVNSNTESGGEYNAANSPSVGTSTSLSSKSSYSSSRSYVSKDDEATAISMAQVMVKNELKSPSTASFPWDFGEYTVKKSGDQYTVTGYVDAQNSFGAKIRSKFEACFIVEMVGTKYKGTKIYTLIYE